MEKREVDRVAKRATTLATRTGKITRAALEGATACDSATARKALRGLVDGGVLRQEGAKRGTFYVPEEE